MEVYLFQGEMDEGGGGGRAMRTRGGGGRTMLQLLLLLVHLTLAFAGSVLWYTCAYFFLN